MFKSTLKAINKPVIIAGAGPGGLTTALALQQKGIPALVFDKTPTIKSLGLGINLLPNAVRILYDLGLKSALETSALQTSELCFFNKWGQSIWSESLGLTAGYTYPQYSIHRGELQTLLYEKVQQQLGQQSVHTGMALESWQEHSEGVVVRFRSEDHSLHEIEGCCLVGADGFHSVTRHALFPDEGAPIYSGKVIWRGISVAEPCLTGRSMIKIGNLKQKFVCYPIFRQGKVVINWVARLAKPDYTPKRQDWNRPANLEDFFAPYTSWRFEWLDVPALIEKAEYVYEYPLVDRNPLPRWTHGCITLLGDAAHPTFPMGSNGACQAMLDANTLANCLHAAVEHGQSIKQALAEYDNIRRPVTTGVILLNRQQGPDQVMDIVETRAPNGFQHIHDVVSHQELAEIALRYKQTSAVTLAHVNQ